MKLPFVSVIVPSKRKSIVLQRCLRSLEEQDYPSALLEIIVASVEPQNIKKVGSITIRNIWCGQVNQAEARNIAETLSKGEILAFCDDDCVLPSRWIANGIKHFLVDNSVATVGGPTIPPLSGVPFREKISGLLMNSYLGTGSHRKAYLKDRQEAHACCPTELICANMFVDRTKFREVGGFDAIVPQEEERLNSKLLKKGYKLIRDPDCFGIHYQRAYGLKYIKNIFWLAMGRARLTVEEPTAINKLYLIPVFFVLGLFTGPFLFWIPLIKIAYISSLVLYTTVLLGESLRLVLKLNKQKLQTFLALPLCFLIHHLTFGIGSIFGYLLQTPSIVKNVYSKLRASK